MKENTIIDKTNWRLIKNEIVHPEVYNIIRSSGNEAMIPKIKAQCVAYCADVLGSEKYYQSYMAYCCNKGEFLEGFIPGNYYGQVVILSINGMHGKVADLKSLPHQLFDTDCFPDLAYGINGWLYSKKGGG